MDATALTTAAKQKAFLFPKGRRGGASSPAAPARLFLDKFLVECSDSTAEELDVHSLGPLTAKRRTSGEDRYGYEKIEMDYGYGDWGGSCLLSASDSAIAYHHPSNRGEEAETPRTKRRRLMNRRNSQTPAMLVTSSATVFLANGGFSDILDRGIDVDEVLNMSLMSLASTEVSGETTLSGHHNDDSTSSDLTGLMCDSQSWTKGVDIAD
jgi:hypothetical protein